MSFKRWLKKQCRRQDPVGDFARDWLDDSDAPPATSLLKVDSHLDGIGVAPEVFAAARRAWVEYRRHTEADRLQKAREGP